MSQPANLLLKKSCEQGALYYNACYTFPRLCPRLFGPSQYFPTYPRQTRPGAYVAKHCNTLGQQSCLLSGNHDVGHAVDWDACTCCSQAIFIPPLHSQLACLSWWICRAAGIACKPAAPGCVRWWDILERQEPLCPEVLPQAAGLEPKIQRPSWLGCDQPGTCDTLDMPHIPGHPCLTPVCTAHGCPRTGSADTAEAAHTGASLFAG